jgi:neutral ceramidase
MKQGGSFLVWAVVLAGCSSHTYLPAPVTSAPTFAVDPAAFGAGAARADITPPPGVSTFGHGPDARVTNGIWTRLYCRAFVIKQGAAALAIVPCDLPAVSAILQRTVAAELAHRNVPIPAPRLMISATHTHAGPAHYFDGEAYSGLGTSQLPGYDEAMTRFLATRIAGAVADAYASAAQMPAEIRWSRRMVYRLTRNRDIAAFVRNSQAPWAPDCEDRSELCAIDPELSVLELRAAPGAKHPGCPLGALTFFAMHPTVLPNTNQLLGADAFGVASRALEEKLRKAANKIPGCPVDPLAGIVNTNEGDISSRFVSASVEEAISIGSALAGEAASAISESNERMVPFDPKPALAARYLEVDLRSNSFGLSGKATCDAPEQGIFGALGATDHPTFLAALRGDADPRDPSRSDCQAPKRAFFAPVKGQASGPHAFPTILPFAVARIGEEAITFVPAELTIAAGHRVNEAVVSRLQPPDRQKIHAIVAGLSNAYIQYVATPEEYDVQGYEGTSTLFGPQTAPLMASIAGALAARLYDDQVTLPALIDEARGQEYFLGPERERLPSGVDDPTLDALASERRAEGLCSIPGARPAAVCFLWTDGAPGVVPTTNPRWVALVGVRRGEEIVLLDDRGVEFRTRVHGPVGDAWLWTTMVRPYRLTPPTLIDWSTLDGWDSLTLRVDIGTSYEIKSAAFGPRALPPPCSSGVQRLCGS